MANAKKPGTGATNKRRKELAAAKAERQQARRVARSEARRRRTRIGWAVAAVAGVLAISAVLFWPDGSTDPVAAPDPLSQPTAPASQSPVQLDGCDPAPTPPSDSRSWEEPPEPKTAVAGATDLVLQTNCGRIVIQTAPAQAPETVDAMIGLADRQYFDSTLCHRVTTEGIKVLQCGDPTATGTGGPGFQLPDENLPSNRQGVNYPAGTVAMANAGPGTSGSQFFIVYADTTLPPNYTIWGQVTSGLDIVEKVADAGVQGGGTDGPPAAPIGIVTATVRP